MDADLVASIPISVRTEAQQQTLGNRISTMLVGLASTVDDPVERLRRIGQATKDAKTEHNAVGADSLQNWAEFMAPAVAARAARFYSRLQLASRHRPFFNLTISNVPGPMFPLYSYGSKVVASYPIGPIFDGGALNITVMSYLGQMFFGLNACREAVPDVDAIAYDIEGELQELMKAASAR